METEAVKERAAVSLEGEARPLNLTEHVARRREWSRTILAGLIVGSLVFIVVGTFVTLWTRQDAKIDDLREMVHILMSPTIGIVGAVMGFYFGERRLDG
jgi:hypothetical protein